MTASLTFMMGQFQAEFPSDRQYSTNHMWALALEDVYRCGFSAYAVRLLQDVYFLDWTVETGTTLQERQEIGTIESSKAEASLYSPIAGVLLQFNRQLLQDPSAINVDKYGIGWLFEIRGDGRSLLDGKRYVEHLGEVWEVTQRTIKGQMNR